MLIKRERKTRGSLPPVAGLAKELIVMVEGDHVDVTAILHDPNEERKYPGLKGKYGIHIALSPKEEQELFELLLSRKGRYAKTANRQGGGTGDEVCIQGSERREALTEAYPKSEISGVAEKFTKPREQSKKARREAEQAAGRLYPGQAQPNTGRTLSGDGASGIEGSKKPRDTTRLAPVMISGEHFPWCMCDICYAPKIEG